MRSKPRMASRLYQPEVISAIGYAREKLAVLTAIGYAHDEMWASRLATKDFAVPASVGDWLRRQECLTGAGMLTNGVFDLPVN